MNDGLKRISIKMGYTTTSGARMTWDAASHRKVTDHTGKSVSALKAEPVKVIKDTIREIARISAICETPAQELIDQIEEAYKAVGEWRASLKT